MVRRRFYAKIGTPGRTVEVLQKYQFNFQKKYGQNFLIEPQVLETIVDAAHIQADDCVLEIGPGIGTMTQYLAEQAREVVAVEIDKAPDPHPAGHPFRVSQCYYNQ